MLSVPEAGCLAVGIEDTRHVGGRCEPGGSGASMDTNTRSDRHSGSADSECVPVLHAGSFLWREGLVLHAGVSVDTHWSLQQEWEAAP